MIDPIHTPDTAQMTTPKLLLLRRYVESARRCSCQLSLNLNLAEMQERARVCDDVRGGERGQGKRDQGEVCVMGKTTGILFVLIRKAIRNLDASCNLEKNAQYW